jgi:hypothetical protein
MKIIKQFNIQSCSDGIKAITEIKITHIHVDCGLKMSCVIV